MENAFVSPAVCRFVSKSLFVQVANSKSKKAEKRQIIEDTITIMNALLNEGSGLLCIHSEDKCFLDKFHESLDETLNLMITDGSLFDENYERICYFGDDPFRVVYRVKPRARASPIVRDFCTKGSLDKGLTELSFHQFHTLLGKVSKPDRPSSEEPAESAAREAGGPFHFVENEEVKYFVESRSRQVKRFPKGERSNQKWVDNVWDFLPKYVSAFSKNEHGGSVFFGVREEKLEPLMKWEQVQQREPPMLKVLNAEWKVWKNDCMYCVAKAEPNIPLALPGNGLLAWERVPEREVPDVVMVTHQDWELWEDPKSDAFHVAREADVPVVKEQSTGRLLVEGRRLSRRERNFVEGKILAKARQELLWLGREDPVEPVAVLFHPVRNERDEELYVLEVVIKHFHGVVFTDKEGPTSFEMDPNENTATRMSFGDWLRAQKTDAGIQWKQLVRQNPR